MNAYRIKHKDTGLYLKDDSMEMQWVKFPHMVIYKEQLLYKFLRKLGIHHDWIEYDEFPDYIEVEHFQMSPIKTINYRDTVVEIDQVNERRYRTRFSTLKRRQKTAEESLDICEA